MTTDAPPAMVERNARIFRFGAYPDRNWSITAEEFRAANGEPRPIPIGMDPVGKGHYEGEESWLDGMTGTAAFSVEGDEVHAKLSLPAWVNEVVEKHKVKISAIFDRATKAIKKIDLVARPRIKDAVVFADAGGDVVLFDDDDPVEFCSANGGVHCQAMHDMAAHARPHLCSPRVGFAKRPEESHDDRTFRQSHDYAVAEGAYCPGMPDGHDEEGEVRMSDEQEQSIEFDLEGAVAFTEEQVATLPARDQALVRYMKKMDAQVAKLQGDLAEKDAILFADSILKPDDRRAVPAERPHIIAGYKRARADDERIGDTVSFADEKGAAKQGSRLEAFKASYLVRPRLTITDPKNISFTELAPDSEQGDAAAKQAQSKADREARRRRNLASAGIKANPTNP